MQQFKGRIKAAVDQSAATAEESEDEEWTFLSSLKSMKQKAKKSTQKFKHQTTVKPKDKKNGDSDSCEEPIDTESSEEEQKTGQKGE